MARIRLYDLASRFGKTPEQIREILTSNGVKLGASPSASVDEAVENKILSEKKASRPRRIAVRRRRKAEAEPEPVVEEAVAEEVERLEVADVIGPMTRNPSLQPSRKRSREKKRLKLLRSKRPTARSPRHRNLPMLTRRRQAGGSAHGNGRPKNRPRIRKKRRQPPRESRLLHNQVRRGQQPLRRWLAWCG